MVGIFVLTEQVLGDGSGVGVVGNAVNMLNPGLIVLGGFLRVFPAFAATVLREELARHCMAAPRALVRIVPATLGAETLVIGAAEMAFAQVLADPGRF